MALTPIRWAAAAVAGCLVMAVLILRDDAPRRRHVDEVWAVRRILDLHGGHASNSARRLRTVSLLDSLGGVLRAPAATAGRVRILRDAALPAALADSMNALAQRAASQMLDTAGTGTDVVFVYDTLSQIHGASVRRLVTQVDYVLPRSRSERCITLVHVGAEAGTRVQLAKLPTDAAAQRLLGPCAYYQAFGLPGREVDAWLKTRGWAFAGDGSWQQASPPVQLMRSIWDGSGPSTLERAMIGRTTLPHLFDMQLTGTQCAAGDADACREALLSRPRTSRIPAVLNDTILFGSFASLTAAADWYPRRLFGRRETWLLADMVRTLGRDRFARFWTSNEPVPAAFEHAAGQPIEQWASSWGTATYGEVPPRGAGVGMGAALVSLAMMLLALGAGVVVSERRQFA